MLQTISTWMESHVWICTFVIAACALLTFLCNFIFKKKNNNVSMKIKNINGGSINQANGNIINKNDAK